MGSSVGASDGFAVAVSSDMAEADGWGEPLSCATVIATSTTCDIEVEAGESSLPVIQAVDTDKMRSRDRKNVRFRLFIILIVLHPSFDRREIKL